MLLDKHVYLEHFDDETTTDQEVAYFLEHFGVKGMKWGIRNDKHGSRKEPMTAAQKRAKERRNVKRVNRVIGTTVAALYIAGLLSSKKSGNIPVSTFTKPNSDNNKSSHIRDATHVIKKDARETLMLQERHRNGAYQIKKMLKEMGEDIV